MTSPLVFGDRSPRLALPYLFAGQAQKEVTVNEALARIDALLSPGVEGESASPPTAPAEGECWIVGPDADGSWEGREGQLALYTAGTWLFAFPQPGLRVFDRAAGAHTTWIDGWRSLSLPGKPAGGQTIDVEARAALDALIGELRGIGFGT